MKLKNINGTSDTNCGCGSWLEHWKKFSGQTLPVFCPEERCIQLSDVGARVQRADSSDDRWYIVPLCKMHNAGKAESLTISDSVNLVSANISMTCGRNS